MQGGYTAMPNQRSVVRPESGSERQRKERIAILGGPIQPTMRDRLCAL
jgi:hypothetical protein